MIYPSCTIAGRGCSFFLKDCRHQEYKKDSVSSPVERIIRYIYFCVFAIKVHWADPVNVPWDFLYIYNN